MEMVFDVFVILNFSVFERFWGGFGDDFVLFCFYLVFLFIFDGLF